MTIQDVAKFMYLGGQYVPSDHNRGASYRDLIQFLARVRSEVSETQDGIEENEHAEIVDGFLDIAYAAMTGAIRKAGAKKAQLCWEAICDANLAKVDGRYGPVVRDEETGKILKPEGWIGPDIEGILNG